MDGIHTSSINEALVTLATMGMEQMVEHVQANLDEKVE